MRWWSHWSVVVQVLVSAARKEWRMCSRLVVVDGGGALWWVVVCARRSCGRVNVAFVELQVGQMWRPAWVMGVVSRVV